VNTLSISVRNFLCYGAQPGAEPYVFNFRDHRLWSICGDNGSGKSAIFDAITYCLFGQHRGGSSRDDELVHRGATEMLASIEFEHAGREYRVTRTIRLGVRPRKGTPTIQRECRLEWLRSDGEWVEVPETSSARGLEDAVRKILGYGCDTLTASVLLLQGKSDRLIDAGGKERFDILSGILDLSRYERLAERARDRAKEARARYQSVARTLEEAPPPDKAVVDAAELAAVEAEKAAEAKGAEENAAERTFAAVGEYWTRVERLRDLRSGEKAMAEAIQEAPTITAGAKEVELLESTMPRLGKALQAQANAGQAQTEAAAAREAAAKVDVVAGERAVTKADQVHAAARLKHQQLVKKIADTRSEMDRLAPEINTAKELERLDAQIKATSDEVAKLQATFAGIAEVRSKVARLRTLEASRGLIGSYRKAREALAGAQSAAEDGDPEAEVQRRRAQRTDLEIAANDAARTESKSLAVLAQADAELSVAQSTLRGREEAGAEGTCSHCGQAVSPAHIKKEITTARAAVRAASEAVSKAQLASAESKRCRESCDAEVAKAVLAESHAAEYVAIAQRARREIEELEESDGFAELPVDVAAVLRAPLADLQARMAGLMPKQAELRALEDQLTRLGAAESTASAKSELVNGWKRNVGDILVASSRERLAEARRREASLLGEWKTHQAQETEARSAEEQAAAAAQSARESQTVLRDRKRELEQHSRLLDERAEGFRQEARGALTGVAEQFLPVTQDMIDGLEKRLAQLDGAIDRLRLLRKAESELEGLRGQIKELQAHIDVTLEAHRIRTDEAKKALTSAQARAQAAKQDARTIRRKADELRSTREQRLRLQAEGQQLAVERAVWEKVGQLLGRGGIQTALMRSALEDIQERSNVMLSRISGGQLQLEVTFDQTSRGEEILFRCLDAASAEQPLDVQFLSGGQRFRCAVALAAGIGQRAGSDGTMPSLIVDEGFGSLDTQGRTEMLDEIRAMSDFYERVIVVSHMESFHDQSLFPARFELSKEGTRTVVTVVG